MKKTLFLILLLGALAFLAAQTQYTPINPISNEDEDVEVYDYEQDDAEHGDEHECQCGESGYLGIFVDDLNFPKAQALKYTKNHGVLVIRVVEDSPAAAAKLQVDDVIMMMDEQVVQNKEQFIEICGGTQAGDTMKLKIWRAGTEQDVELILAEKSEDDEDETSRKITVSFKPNLNTGYGGGSWVPMWAVVNLDDINNVLKDLNFKEMKSSGVLMQGGAGKMHIGKGFFFGIQGVSYENKGKRNKAHPDSVLTANYELGTFEFTIDKRFAVKPWLVLSIGTGLGSATHKLELYRDESGGNWPSPSEYQLGYHKAVLKKDYFTVHPRFEALFPLLSWFGLRMELGYNYGFSPYNGWKEEEHNGHFREINGSPDTKFGAFTIGAGPWFGF